MADDKKLQSVKDRVDSLVKDVRELKSRLTNAEGWRRQTAEWVGKEVLATVGKKDFAGKLLWADNHSYCLDLDGDVYVIPRAKSVLAKYRSR
jgi:hypothetical protein